LPRTGAAFALAVPVFPLGNVSFGLAVAYGIGALAWLVLAWPRPRSALLFAVGPLIPLAGAVALLPLILQRVRGWFRRAAYAAAGALATAVVGPEVLAPVAAEESPLAVARWGWAAATADAVPGALALVVAAAAAILPYCLRKGELAIAGFGAALLAAALVTTPNVRTGVLVATAWTTTAALLVQWRRSGGEPAQLHAFVTFLRTTRALFVDRLKPAGGSRWPQAKMAGIRWPQALASRRLGHLSRR
jgi:hypothetical protein